MREGLSQTLWSQCRKSVWSVNLRNKNIVKINRGKHPAIVTPEVVYRLIKLFTKPNDVILDPFAGVGTIPCVAGKLNRNCIGIEINPKYVYLATRNIKANNFPHSNIVTVIEGDSNKLLELINKKVDLVLTSPPYPNSFKYSKKNGDISDYINYEDYLEKIEIIVKNLIKLLKKNKKMIIIVGDSQKGKEYLPAHADIINIGKKNGLLLTHMIINSFPPKTKKRARSPSFGYPNHFFVEFLHDYILIFEKTR